MYQATDTNLLETVEASADGSVVLEGAGRVLEAADEAGREWDVLLIQAGLSLNNRYYPADVLREAVSRFEGRPAFADHQTEYERQARPERSIREKVGVFRNVEFVEMPGPDGQPVAGLKARFKVAAPWLRETLREAVALNEPDFLGFSIDAIGVVRPKQHDGRTVQWVEAIRRVRSVDVVTDPAAGGRLLRLVASHSDQEEVAVNITKEEIAALFAEQMASMEAKLSERVAEQVKEALAAAKPADEPKADEPAKAHDEPAQAAEQLNVAEANAASVTVSDGKPAVSLDELRETMGLAKQAKAELRKLNGLNRLNEALAQANLSAPGKDRIRKAFTELLERRDFDDAELKQAIAEAQAYEAALVDQHVKPLSEGRAPAKAGDSEADQLRKALEGWFVGEAIDGVKPVRDLRESYARWYGVSYLDVNLQEFFQSFGTRYDSETSHKRVTESLSTVEWGDVFADVMYNRMLKEYEQNPDYNKWQLVVSDIEPLIDFQTRHLTGVGGYGDLPIVGERETYPLLTSPGTQQTTYKPAKRGGLEEITWEMVLGDKLSQVRRIPRKLAEAAAHTLYTFVFDMITVDNPVMGYDGTTLYHVSHGNDDDIALSVSGFAAVRMAMRAQTPFGNPNKPLGTRNLPRIVIVPKELEMLARRIFNPSAAYQMNVSTDVDTNIDPHAWANEGIEIHVYDELQDANDWYAVADPRRVETMTIGFLNGNQNPELFVQDQANVGSTFTADKITYKIRHVYGATVTEHRSFFRNVISNT